MRRAFACLLAMGLVVAAAPVRPEESADTVLARAEERFAALSAYECVLESEARKGTREERGVYRLWFKRPGMLRIRVLRGRHAGSEVAIDRAGAIRGHQGGLLRGIVLRLSATDPRLRSLRGTRVTELDWGSFYRRLKERAARPGARCTLAGRTGDGACELLLTYADGGHSLREVYRLDPGRGCLLAFEAFEDGVRVERALFREVRLNPPLSDRDFEL